MADFARIYGEQTHTEWAGAARARIYGEQTHVEWKGADRARIYGLQVHVEWCPNAKNKSSFLLMFD